MASNYDGNKGVNGNGLLYFIGKVKTWIDTYFLKKNLGSSKASKVVVTDSSGNVDVSTITTTELGYLDGLNQNIVTALNAKAYQQDFLDLGNGFQTFVNTTAPATYQKKMTIGGGTAGAVTTISAGDNVSITTVSDSDTATISASIPQATTTTLGGVKVPYTNTGSVTPQAKSTTADRYYGVELDTHGLAVVNVPWTDTKMSNKSYTAGTDTKVVVGTKITGNNTLADTQKTLTAGAGISITGTTSAITIANTYSYTLPQATASVLGGVKVSGTDASGENEGGTYGWYIPIDINTSTGVIYAKPKLVGSAGEEDALTSANAYLPPSNSYVSLRLGTKAPLASPALTGTPTAPTAATSTNTTQIATTAFVHAAIENADIGGKTYQGNIDAENSATGKRALKDIKTFKQGQYFTVSSAFTFADGSWALGIGDMLFVKENYTWASGNVDGSKFAAVQGNNDYLTNSELDAIFTEVFGSAA